MTLDEITIPLGSEERAALYGRLGEMGARVFSDRSGGLFRDLTEEEILAVAAEQSRFDYRLLYVLVSFVAEEFSRLHPFRLQSATKRMRTPAVWGVIAEFVRKVRSEPTLEAFLSIILEGTTPAAAQMFYNSARAPRPILMQQIAERTPEEFLRWGFFSDEVPLLKELTIKHKRKTFSAERRKLVLKRLLGTKERVAVSDYLAVLDYAISRQQAHYDLRNFPGIRMHSDRRGRRYSFEPPGR